MKKSNGMQIKCNGGYGFEACRELLVVWIVINGNQKIIFCKNIQSVLKKESNILVFHQGPDDQVTERIGEPLVRELLEKQGAVIVIFGHCQWQNPYAEIGKHQVFNIDGRVMLLVNE
ncbi:MAG: metallophosphoesterase family protein [Mariprofundaceae bacterium]